MSPDHFIASLQAISLENVFNPYIDKCNLNDLDNAPQIRAHTLASILEAATKVELEAIWIGRDLGYRGGRRTGLALTDDINLTNHAARWGINIDRATEGDAISERTAAVIWSLLSEISEPVFLWNVFPFHPYNVGNEFSNRQHTRSERDLGEQILESLISILKPKKIIAIGNDAAYSISKLSNSVNSIHVRHPSYGGKTEFIEQIRVSYHLL
jgi:hypothetical protein